MAPHAAYVTDDSYSVDIGTVKLNSLSETASPRLSGPSVPDPNPGSFVSCMFPISKDSPEIRVLDLQTSDHFDDPLVGTFRIVSLAEECDPYFTALSYVWGASQPTQGITIDLKVGALSITRNCQDALRQIRHLYGSTTIWVDSICIDQSCETERCHQVSLMGDVYSRAKKVYIWLGEETPGRRRALECVDFAATFMYLPLDRDAAGGVSQRLKFQLKVIPPLATIKLLRNWWKRRALLRSYRHAEFEELLGAAWFSRIWTFQEIVLATDAIILCGTATLNWSVFARGFRCLNSLLADNVSSWDSEDWYPVRHRLVLRERSMRIKGQEEDSEGMASRPRGFLALQRVLFLWLRVDRQGLRHNNRPVYGTAGGSSILWHQRPYIDMSNRHLRKLGLVCTHVAAFILLCGITLAGMYHQYFTTGQSTYIAAFDSLGGLALFLFFLYTTLFNPEGFSNDLNMKSSEQQVIDQLMSAVVETLSYRHAREPKDRSYALYGVLRGFGVDLAPLDYNKPQARIYHELCVDMLRFRPSAISMLLYANTVQQGQASLDTRTEESPTWVPDWSRLETKQFVSLQPSSIPEIYCATEKGLAAVARYSNDRRAIFVSGQWQAAVTFCMGSLQIISDRSPRSLSQNDALCTSIKAFSGWVGALKKSVFAEYLGRRRSSIRVGACASRSTAAHPATLVLDLMVQRTALREADHELVAISRIFNIFAQEPQVEGSESCEMTLQAAQDILTLLRNQDLLDHFVGMINCQAKNNSRWFITSNGQLGCGTGSVMPGDRLALVAGVAAPMVLRPLDLDKQDWFDSRYLAVCSAYVSGWMYGEVFSRESLGEIHVI